MDEPLAGAEAGQEEDNFNYGYNFEFSEKTIRLGIVHVAHGTT